MVLDKLKWCTYDSNHYRAKRSINKVLVADHMSSIQSSTILFDVVLNLYTNSSIIISPLYLGALTKYEIQPQQRFTSSLLFSKAPTMSLVNQNQINLPAREKPGDRKSRGREWKFTDMANYSVTKLCCSQNYPLCKLAANSDSCKKITRYSAHSSLSKYQTNPFSFYIG